VAIGESTDGFEKRREPPASGVTGAAAEDLREPRS
jgi:hypothetical protein